MDDKGKRTFLKPKIWCCGGRWSVQGDAQFYVGNAYREGGVAYCLRCKNAALAERLLEVMHSLLRRWLKEKIKELTQCLAEKLSARERSVAEKRHMKDSVAVNEKLNEQGIQLSVSMADLKGDVMNGKKTVVDLIVKLHASEKRPEDVAYERYGLQACLQQSQREQDKLCESIIRIQDKIDRYRAGLKEDQKYTYFKLMKSVVRF